MVKPQPRPRGYWLRLSGCFLLTLFLALPAIPLLIGCILTYGLVYSPCADNGATPADFSVEWEDVTLAARAGGQFKGYFIPGRNRAAIIVVPPLNNGRAGRLAEAMLLARAGFTILTFESRRCAGMGGLSLGYRETEEVADALDYLLTRPEVDPERIGVHGFSSAGATAVMAAARLPQLKAVVAEGGYGDFAAEALDTSGSSGLPGYFEGLVAWSMVHSYPFFTGLDINQLSPTDVIGQIAPRPILLIYGSQEVSLVGGQQQAAAAGNNAKLWIVPGAGHGNYLAVAPEAYEAQLVTFFEEALLQQNR
jgi:dienelactone hydrolase